MVSVAEVTQRLTTVRRRIETAGGEPDRVTIVAMTKGFGPEVVDTALASGFADLGENYAQDLVAKAHAVRSPPRWHFIGQLQRNKVRSLASLVHLWQTVDRDGVAAEIARRAPGADVLVQINATGEPGKGGCNPASAPALVGACLDLGLTVRGLMVVGPTEGGPEAARPAFRLVRRLADELSLAERSMGMSTDLEVAVAEGSTMVRLGTALFGPRPAR